MYRSLVLLCILASSSACTVFISEIHYDNVGADTGEAVEVCGPAGTDLTGWKIFLYNSFNNGVYGNIPLDGTIPNQSAGYGCLAFEEDPIQNGPSDGLALVDPGSNVEQFLSYEGSLTAEGGPADGLTSTDIGVSESSSTPVGTSLQLEGTGKTCDDFSWTAGESSSFGDINANMFFACDDDSDCDVPAETCCSTTSTCELVGLTACGDPHMTGFRGQKFDFTGKDNSWYVLVSDLPSVHINMRVTAPVSSLPEITYITGISVITTDADDVSHSIVITVKEPHNLASTCVKGISSCLAEGSLDVVLDGQESLVSPGTHTLAPDVMVTAVNLPGECRSFGFEKYWERKVQEYAQQPARRLGESFDMGEWILADPTATNMQECTEYVARCMAQEDGLFAHQSEHASFQIITPKATIRLSHGRLHQLAVRDPTDRFDLPDHLTWQMNLAIDRTAVSPAATGVLGETVKPILNAAGIPIMSGMEAIHGIEEDYYVDGPLGIDFNLA